MKIKVKKCIFAMFTVLFAYAVVSCSNVEDDFQQSKPIEAQEPKIIFVSKDVTVSVGKEIVLSVKAQADDSGTLSYQWFSGDAAESTAINGATEASLPFLALNEGGGYSFYCEVTNRLGESEKRTRSSVINVTVQETDNTDAVLLVVTQEHRTVLGFTADNAIQYQWYECADADGNNGMPIEGATNPFFFTGPYSQPGIHYYYCSVQTQSGTKISRVIAVAYTEGKYLLLSADFGVIEGTNLTLTVIPALASHKIYYTTDGTPAAERFSRGADSEGLFLYGAKGIAISESKNPGDYALTPNVTYTSGTYTFGYVSKGVPLSLIEVDEGGEIVAEKRGTFVFVADGKSHFGNVPVVCLSAPVDEWIGADKKSGVYNTVSEELKLRAHLEYYDYGADEFFALNTQIKRGGNLSKTFPLRTLNANFKKDENGNKNEKPSANIFQDRLAFGTGEPIRGEVRRFRLHSGGNNVFSAFFSDAFIQRMVSLSNTNVATAAYRPCVLYLNGEYWGVYGLREHYNEDYIEYTFGVDADDVVYVEKSYYPELEISKYSCNVKTDDIEMGFKLLDELYDFLEISEDGTALEVTKDWSSDEVYEEFCKLVDVDGLIDIFLIRGYVNDWDFPYNNFRMWRTVPNPSKSKTKKSKYADGKWRFMIHDTDYGCVDSKGQQNLSAEAKADGKNNFDFYIGNCTHAYNYRCSPRDHRIFSLPLQNKAFRKKLWERAKYIQDTVFAPAKAIAVLNAMEAEVEPLYADKVARWGASGYSVTKWKSEVEVRRSFLRERGGYFLDNVRSAFGIGDEITQAQ